MKKQKYDLYGGMPPHEDVDTSRAAAEAAEPSADQRRARVFALITQQGAFGATDDEIELMLEYPHQTASARRRELVLDGQVRDSGQRRLTRNGRWARVWIVGRDEQAAAKQLRRVATMPRPHELRRALTSMRALYVMARDARRSIPNEPELIVVCRWIQQMVEGKP